VLTHLDDGVSDSDLGMADAPVWRRVSFEFDGIEGACVEVDRRACVADDEIGPHGMQAGAFECRVWWASHVQMIARRAGVRQGFSGPFRAGIVRERRPEASAIGSP
jgi:hypothetical protein